MSDALDHVTEFRLVFGCLDCGTLLSVDNKFESGARCPNCGAGYDYSGDAPYRYASGRPPSQWVSHGYDPAPEPRA